MNKLSIRDLSVKGKRVLVRVDFNVPQNEDGTISDDTRIVASLPTIQYLIHAGASIILMSHLGRPKGKKDPKFTLAPCAKRLSELLKQPVMFVSDCIGPEVEKKVKAMKPKDVLLLENLRFYAAEEEPESHPDFAKKLALLGEIYVNDAFGTAHRAHASTAVIAQYFPNAAAAGFLLEKEINFLGTHLSHPKRPFYAIIGGAKISTKMGVLESLLSKVDALFIGGGMAYTLLKAKGIEVGDSIHEDELLEKAEKFLAAAEKKKIPIYLPEDIIIADRFEESASKQTIDVKKGVSRGWQGMDIGPKTIAAWKSLLQKGATVFWNGPVGVFEMKPFAKGTEEIAKTVANLRAITIVGGGDSVAAVNQLHLSDKFSHISTGGGASLEYIEFGHLPGIDALSNKE